MLFVLLSKRFLHMTLLDGFAFVAIHANLLDCYKHKCDAKKLRFDLDDMLYDMFPDE